MPPPALPFTTTSGISQQTRTALSGPSLRTRQSSWDSLRSTAHPGEGAPWVPSPAPSEPSPGLPAEAVPFHSVKPLTLTGTDALSRVRKTSQVMSCRDRWERSVCGSCQTGREGRDDKRERGPKLTPGSDCTSLSVASLRRLQTPATWRGTQGTPTDEPGAPTCRPPRARRQLLVSGLTTGSTHHWAPSRGVTRASCCYLRLTLRLPHGFAQVCPPSSTGIELGGVKPGPTAGPAPSPEIRPKGECCPKPHTRPQDPGPRTQYAEAARKPGIRYF